MSDSKPYNTGNDEWILAKAKDQVGQLLGAQFTSTELLRLLYLAAEGEIHLSRGEVEIIERRIIKLQDEARAIAVRAAKTKN